MTPDQPKPATVEPLIIHDEAESVKELLQPASGEWTVKHDNMIYAGETFVTLIKDNESRERVVSIHNAALAAEKNLRADWNYVIEELEKQLAAEQEKTESARKTAAAFWDQREQAINELAAEREKVQNLQSWIDTAQQNYIHRLNELQAERDAEREKVQTLEKQLERCLIELDATQKSSRRNGIRAEDNPGFHRHE